MDTRYLTEPWPEWLRETSKTIARQECAVRLRPGTSGLARQLLRALELDALPRPAVSLVSTGLRGSGLVFTWTAGRRRLYLEVVGRDEFGLCTKAEGGELLCRYVPARGLGGVHEFRQAIAELYQDVYPKRHKWKVAEGLA